MTTFRIKNESTAYNVMDGEATVIHTETSAYYSLNTTGTIIWELLTKREFTIDQLSNFLADHFGINASDIEKDMVKFLSQLQEAELAEVAEKTSNQDLVPAVDMSAVNNYEAPDLVKFGDLETLMLSGE